MVDMGILPMKGNTSFSSQVLTLSCVPSARFAAVFASHSRATASNVFAAASALAFFSSRLAALGSTPSASSVLAAARRSRAFASEISG
ncbi:hypothetical protein D3C87_1590080 [compost metagenome]